jgi:hypothetical protein
MGHKIRRPLVFCRQDEAEENYLVVMHYLAMTLWIKGRGVDAVRALHALLPNTAENAQAVPSDAAADPVER